MHLAKMNLLLMPTIKVIIVSPQFPIPRGDKRQKIGMPDAQIPIPLTPFQITWTCIDVCHLDLFLQVPQEEKVVSQILTGCRWGSDRDVSEFSISVCI
ncbi:hypothetical protein NPIL_648881 [Nephila pilipes]|uniref:Uncharacterized protein n=1 Tax=Nephila pilipes TaxID=299642 RepID=A0A8X6P650_NEPPI|nr:hypothetical protein NPIL_648881 [Nephila pilipes]